MLWHMIVVFLHVESSADGEPDGWSVQYESTSKVECTKPGQLTYCLCVNAMNAGSIIVITKYIFNTIKCQDG